MRAVLRNRQVLTGLIIIGIWVILAIIGPGLAKSPYDEPNLTNRFAPPLTDGHIFGTDQFGRDVWARTTQAIRISLVVGLAGAASATIIGTLLGAWAGYKGGVVDLIIGAVTDIAWSFPLILIVLVLVAMDAPGVHNVILGLAMVGWSSVARIVRGEVRSLREREFVTASLALGVPQWKIIATHIIPNTLSTVLVLSTTGVAMAIMVEAALSFLGVGVQAPAVSLGFLLNEGRMYMGRAVWIGIFPGLVLASLVFAFNLVGDGLRSVLDPAAKRGGE